MNQIYVILGGLLWRLLGKRICLWYAHGSTSMSLVIAEKLAHIVVTSTPEGFRLPSKKVHIVGQGIDVAQIVSRKGEYNPEKLRILCIGRVSPIKRCEVLVEATKILKSQYRDLSVIFIGDTTDSVYWAELGRMIDRYNLGEVVMFVGPMPHERVFEYLARADILANPSATGSLDKVGLEALAAGVPVVTSNEAFTEILGEYAERLMFQKDNPTMLAEKIHAVHHAPERARVVTELAERVKSEHGVSMLVSKILKTIAQ